MKNIQPTNQCPHCHVYAAVNSVAHCDNPQCTWNRCTCGTAYDRHTTQSFGRQRT